jgi:hypothetical protein
MKNLEVFLEFLNYRFLLKNKKKTLTSDKKNVKKKPDYIIYYLPWFNDWIF